MQKSDLHTDYTKGRGAQVNTKNRFLKNEYIIEHSEGIDDWEKSDIKTQFIYEKSNTIVNEVSSPDVGMSFSLNPYRGCEHGCIYCYARNSHEYWGYSAGIDFESKIIVKENAPELLQKLLSGKSWQPAVISLSGNTDCYQPIERKLQITRKLLKILLEHRNPVGIITKNSLILRDIDLLEELAAMNLVKVYTSITAMDENIRMQLEPRTATYKNRLNVIEKLSAKGIPCGVMNAPIIPGINDTEIHKVLKSAADAGALWAGYTIVRLNGSIGDIFKDWIQKTYPDRAEKVLHLIESCHGGKINDSTYGQRMKGSGLVSEMIKKQFALACQKYNLNTTKMDWNYSLFRRLKGGQAELF